MLGLLTWSSSVPLTGHATIHGDLFRRMKRTAIFINITRGEITYGETCSRLDEAISAGLT